MFQDLQGAVGGGDVDESEDSTDHTTRDDDTGDDTSDDGHVADVLLVSDAVIGYCAECINIIFGFSCFSTCHRCHHRCHHRLRYSVCGTCSLPSLAPPPKPPALSLPEGGDLCRFIFSIFLFYFIYFFFFINIIILFSNNI